MWVGLADVVFFALGFGSRHQATTKFNATGGLVCLVFDLELDFSLRFHVLSRRHARETGDVNTFIHIDASGLFSQEE